jgi:hypothetical protein
MDQSARRIGAILLATAVAGPVFLICLVGATLWDFVPRPIPFEAMAILPFLLALFVAFFVGLIIAFVPVALGTVAMSALAERWDAARAMPAWAAAGAISGGGILFLLGQAPGASAFALMATSMACAMVARRCMAE